MDLENTHFEKRYKVYIEMTRMCKDDYRFLRPNLGSDYSDKPHFYLTYHFEKSKTKNPTVEVDVVEGKDFKERAQIIRHFKRHHALAYAAEYDGIDEITKEV